MSDKFLMAEIKNDLMDAIRGYYSFEWMGVKTLDLLSKHELACLRAIEIFRS